MTALKFLAIFFICIGIVKVIIAFIETNEEK